MRRKALIVVCWLLVMALFGFGVNRFIASRQNTAITAPPEDPLKVQTQFALPGTIYVTQGGTLYALNGSRFSKLALPTTDPQGDQVSWTQPVPLSVVT